MARRKTHEEFVAEVKEIYGSQYTVLGTYKNSKTKLAIHCLKCQVSFEITPGSFVQGHGCSKCGHKRGGRKLRKSQGDFLEELARNHGNDFTVISQYNGAHKPIQVIHNVCGFQYEMNAGNVLRNGNCPKCANRKRRKSNAKDVDEFILEIRTMYRGEYELVGEYVNSHTKTDFIHTKCGNVIAKRPGSLLRGEGCGVCSESRGERSIRYWLIDNQVDFIPQFPIRYSVEKRPLRLDFYVLGVAIEYDGEYHYQEKPHAGGKSALKDTQRRDAIKTQYCADNGIPLIRIPYWDFDNIDAILTEKLLPLLKVDASSTQKNAS